MTIEDEIDLAVDMYNAWRTAMMEYDVQIAEEWEDLDESHQYAWQMVARLAAEMP